MMSKKTNKGKTYKISEKRIQASWVKYRVAIFEQKEKARQRGDYSEWQWADEIKDYETYRSAYKAQRAENQALAKAGLEYKKSENITRQLIKQARTWTKPRIAKYAKIAGMTTKEAMDALSKMTKQQLFDAYLQMFDGDYDAAAALYNAVVHDAGEATVQAALKKSEEIAEARRLKAEKANELAR